MPENVKIDENGLVTSWRIDNGHLIDVQKRNEAVIVGHVSFEQGKLGKSLGFHGDGFVQETTNDFPTQNSDRTVVF